MAMNGRLAQRASRAALAALVGVYARSPLYSGLSRPRLVPHYCAACSGENGERSKTTAPRKRDLASRLTLLGQQAGVEEGVDGRRDIGCARHSYDNANLRL